MSSPVPDPGVESGSGGEPASENREDPIRSDVEAPEPRRGQPAEARRFGLGIHTWNALGAVAGLASAITGLYFGFHTSSPRSPTPQGATRSAAPKPTAASPSNGSDLAFVRPSKGLIPRCTDIKGTGHAPNGYRIWVAFRSETDRQYYLASVTVDADDANTWQSTKAIVGEAADVHARFHFYAFNAPVSDNAKLTELSYGKPVNALPRHRGRVATMVVARNGTDTAPCSYD